MQFKVPQNIDMADRVVGPLTLIQFLYLLIGGIIDYVLFSIISPINVGLFFALAIPIGLFSFALAFLKLQDQPFGKFVISFILFLIKPKTRVWTKDEPEAGVVITANPVKKDTRITTKTIKKSDLQRLTQTLDTGGAVAARAPQPVARPTVDAMRKQ